ncbi:shikimate dehydrogenase, partial [Mycobacterium sp. ITM-2017-0098]
MTQRPYLVGLVGTGVGPSLTPALHMTEAGYHGLDYVYRTLDLAELHIAPSQIGEVLSWARALGYDA